MKNHDVIIKKIANVIENEFRIDHDLIVLEHGETINNYVHHFLIKFNYTLSDPMITICLNFNVYFDKPDSIFFETIHVEKRYDKSSEYLNLITDIIEFVNQKIAKK